MENQETKNDYLTVLETRRGNRITTVVNAYDRYDAVHECIDGLSGTITFDGTIKVYRVYYCVPEIQLSELLYKSKLKF